MKLWLKCLGSWCGGSGRSNLPAGPPGDEIRRTELPLEGLTPLGPGSRMFPQALEGAAPWLSWDELDLKHALLWSDRRGLVPAQGIWLLAGPLGS